MWSSIAMVGGSALNTVDLFNQDPRVNNSDKFTRATSPQNICQGTFNVNDIYSRAYALSPGEKRDFIIQVSGLKSYLASGLNFEQAVSAVVFLANGGSDCNDANTPNKTAADICRFIMGMPVAGPTVAPTSTEPILTTTAYGEASGPGGKVSENVWEQIKDSAIGTLEQNLQNLTNQLAVGASATETAAASASASSARQAFFAGMDMTTILILGLGIIAVIFVFFK